MRSLAALGTLAFLAVSALQAQQIKPEWKDVIGTWQGTSACAETSSSCTDEQALYRVKPDKSDPDKLTLEAFRMVNNRPEHIGNFSCKYAAEGKVLTCYGAKRDIWSFNVGDNTMDGTVTVGKQKTLYRKITLAKK